MNDAVQLRQIPNDLLYVGMQLKSSCPYNYIGRIVFIDSKQRNLDPFIEILWSFPFSLKGNCFKSNADKCIYVLVGKCRKLKKLSKELIPEED